MKKYEEEIEKASSSMTIRFYSFEYKLNWSNPVIQPLKYGETHSECKKLK